MLTNDDAGGDMIASSTHDRFLATTDFEGSTQRTTLEGYLVIEGAAVARTGEMLYRAGEVPVPPGPYGLVRIRRSEEEVFKPESLESLDGKPLVNDHPPPGVMVNATNWTRYVVGHVTNPRRGEGDRSNLLLVDICVYDPRTIADVQAGKRDLSAGYDPKYYRVRDGETGEVLEGVGEQKDILYNHVALVAKGRCGESCSIGDCDTAGDATMPLFRRRRKLFSTAAMTTDARADDFFARLREALGPLAMDKKALTTTLDAAEAEYREGEEVEPAPGEDAAPGESHVHVHVPGESHDEEPPWFKEHRENMDAAIAGLHERLGKLEGGGEEEGADDEAILGELEMEAPPGTGDKARSAKDSAFLEPSYRRTLAAAEILAPGIRVPAFDRKADPRDTFTNAICATRRTALDVAYASPALRGVIEAAMSGRPLNTKTMTCDAVRTVFSVAARVQAENNNRMLAAGGTRTADAIGATTTTRTGGVRSLADINRMNGDKWKRPVAAAAR